MVTTYMTNQEALRVAQVFNSQLQLRDILWHLSDAHVATIVKIKKNECWPVDLTTIEEEDLLILKHAEAAFMINSLAGSKAITLSPGMLQSQTEGKFKVEMQRNVPMFFFGGKDESVRGEQIFSMLSSMTPWQLGNYYADAYCASTITVANIFYLTVDRTTRGRGWNHVLEDEEFT